MQIIVHVPDDLVEKAKDRLPPPGMGVLEAIALDAILGFLQKLGNEAPRGAARGRLSS